APTKVSVVAAGSATASGPPATVMSRKVMVKETPPAPAVPFAVKQKDLAAHPGVPEDPAVMAEYHKKEKAQNALVKSAVVSTGPGKRKPAREGITAATPVTGNTGKTGSQSSTQTGGQTTGQTGDVVKNKNKNKGDSTGSTSSSQTGSQTAGQTGDVV